jgi:hypothetical protein
MSCAGDRRFLGPLEGGREQVAGRQAAVWPRSLGDSQDLLLGGEVVELMGGPDSLTERKVTRQDAVFSLQREDEGALHGPGTDTRNRGELGHELVVWQAAQDDRVQPAMPPASSRPATARHGPFRCHYLCY